MQDTHAKRMGGYRMFFGERVSLLRERESEANMERAPTCSKCTRTHKYRLRAFSNRLNWRFCTCASIVHLLLVDTDDTDGQTGRAIWSARMEGQDGRQIQPPPRHLCHPYHIAQSCSDNHVFLQFSQKIIPDKIKVSTGRLMPG